MTNHDAIVVPAGGVKEARIGSGAVTTLPSAGLTGPTVGLGEGTGSQPTLTMFDTAGIPLSDAPA